MASAMSIAVGRRSVPLNTICSRKWATPPFAFARPGSGADEDVDADGFGGTGVVTTRRPFSWLTSGVTGMMPVYRAVCLRSAEGESNGRRRVAGLDANDWYVLLNQPHEVDRGVRVVRSNEY